MYYYYLFRNGIINVRFRAVVGMTYLFKVFICGTPIATKSTEIKMTYSQ